MLVPDVNVFVNAVIEPSIHHRPSAEWLRRVGTGRESVAISDFVMSSVVRVTTGVRMEKSRRTAAEAFAFCEADYKMPTAARIAEGPRHWSLFREIVLASGISGPDVTDAYLAAFALENDATFVTFDRGFRRFPGLRVFVLE